MHSEPTANRRLNLTARVEEGKERDEKGRDRKGREEQESDLCN